MRERSKLISIMSIYSTRRAAATSRPIKVNGWVSSWGDLLFTELGIRCEK